MTVYNTAEPKVDLTSASRFITHMVEGEAVTFQTFDDDAARQSKDLVSIVHGDLDECFDKLLALNIRGAGIFYVVNYTDGTGRRVENVTGVRALFLDLDGAPLDPVLAASPEPHAVVESSSGKWHVYWQVTGCALDQFKPAQQALAARFDGDPAVCDLPRVLRVPGFVHRKGAPFVTRVHSLAPLQPYDFKEFVQLLGLKIEAPPPRVQRQRIDPATGEITARIPAGGRHAHLLNWALQLNWRGMPFEAVQVALQAENLLVCDPPKSAVEIDRLARDVMTRYASQHGRDLQTHHAPEAATPEDGAEQAATWVQAVRNWKPPPDLDALDIPVKFAVEGWIQAGKVGALVAAGSTGKTTLLLSMGICIALGREFFGAAVTPGTFVLLSPDDSQQDLDAALARVAKALQLTPPEKAIVAQKVRVISLQGLAGTKTFTTAAHGTTVDTGLAGMILQAVEGIGDLVGIALDTLRQFSGGNSNDEQVIKLTITGATEVAQRTGAFVILPHHTGKQNYRDGVGDMYAGSGSAAIADNCRFVLLLQTTTWADIESKVRRTGREQGDPLVLTSTRGSLLVRAPEPMFLHRSGYLIERVAGAVLTDDQQADERDRAVLRAVRDGRQTKTEIAAAVRGRKTDILARVDGLIARGLLSFGNQSGTGKLQVAGRGATFLDAV